MSPTFMEKDIRETIPTRWKTASRSYTYCRRCHIHLSLPIVIQRLKVLVGCSSAAEFDSGWCINYNTAYKWIIEVNICDTCKLLLILFARHENFRSNILMQSQCLKRVRCKNGHPLHCAQVHEIRFGIHKKGRSI